MMGNKSMDFGNLGERFRMGKDPDDGNEPTELHKAALDLPERVEVKPFHLFLGP